MPSPVVRAFNPLALSNLGEGKKEVTIGSKPTEKATSQDDVSRGFLSSAKRSSSSSRSFDTFLLYILLCTCKKAEEFNRGGERNARDVMCRIYTRSLDVLLGAYLSEPDKT